MDSLPPPRASRSPAPAIVAIAALAAIGSTWIGLSMLWASKARNHQAETDHRIDTVVDVAREAASRMQTTAFSQLAPVSEACGAALDDQGTNSILFVVERQQTGSLSALGGGEKLLPTVTVVGVDPQGKLKMRSGKEPRRDNDKFVARMLATPPWKWNAAVEASTEWGDEARAVRRVAVVLMREGGPPRMVSDTLFEGGRAGLHVRVVKLDGTMLCEGRTTAEVRQVRSFGSFGSSVVDASFSNAVETSAVLDLCRANGGEQTCEAARHQLSLL